MTYTERNRKNQLLIDAIDNFLADRFSMDENNKEVKNLAKLLVLEGNEFNERLDQLGDAFVSDENELRISEKSKENSTDLRLIYELADIAIFSITFLRKLSIDFRQVTIHDFINPSQPQLIFALNRAIGAIDMWSKDGLSTDYVIRAIEEALSCAFMLLAGLDVDPTITCLEKVGHNNLRYPAKLFAKGSDYERTRMECKANTKKFGLEEQFRKPI